MIHGRSLLGSCGSANNSWERSPNSGNSNNFCNVNNNGNANANNANNTNLIAPFGSLAFGGRVARVKGCAARFYMLDRRDRTGLWLFRGDRGWWSA